MPKTKDIVVIRNDGLYAVRCVDGNLGFSTKSRATHFTGRSVAKKEFPILEHYNTRFVDLNNRNDKN